MLRREATETQCQMPWTGTQAADGLVACSSVCANQLSQRDAVGALGWQGPRRGHLAQAPLGSETFSLIVQRRISGALDLIQNLKVLTMRCKRLANYFQIVTVNSPIFLPDS
jgi:hypothetical protein